MRLPRCCALLTLLVATACGGSEAEPASARAPATRAVLQELAPSWASKVGGWNKAVAIAPTGEVVTVEGTTLRVHRSVDGTVVRSAPICSAIGPDALRFASPTLLVAACDDEWVTFSWPELAKTRGPRVHMSRGAAIGADRIAAVWGRRRVRLWKNSGDFALIDWFDVQGEVSALALSPDGGVLAIATDEGLLARDVAAQTNRVLHPDRRTRALSFSPDGRRLFAGAETGAVEIDVGTGGVLRHVHIDYLAAVRYLTDDVVVATGSRGLYLVEKGHGRVELLGERLDAGLDVAGDAGRVCAGGHDGDVRCFSTRGYGRRARSPDRLAALPRTAPPPETLDPIVDGPRAAKPPGGAPQGTKLAWSLYSDGWRRLALAPTGDLVAAEGGMINVHSARDGRVTSAASLCERAIDHLSFLDPGRLFFMCNGAAGIVSFPGVAVVSSHRFDDAGERVAAGGPRFAFETRLGKSIRVHALDGWAVVDDFPIASRLEALALSPDGKRLAYSLFGSGILVRDLATRKETVVAADAKGDGLAFSPDGKRLFALARSFQAVEFDLQTGTQKARLAREHLDHRSALSHRRDHRRRRRRRAHHLLGQRRRATARHRSVSLGHRRRRRRRHLLRERDEGRGRVLPARCECEMSRRHQGMHSAPCVRCVAATCSSRRWRRASRRWK